MALLASNNAIVIVIFLRDEMQMLGYSKGGRYNTSVKFINPAHMFIPLKIVLVF